MGAFEVLKGCNFVKAKNVTEGDRCAELLLKMVQQFQTSSQLPEALLCAKAALQQPMTSKLSTVIVNTAGFVLTSLVKNNQVDKATEIWQELLLANGSSGLTPTELFLDCCSHLVIALCKRGKNDRAISLVKQSIAAGWHHLGVSCASKNRLSLAGRLAPLEVSLLLQHVINNPLQGPARDLEILCSTCE